MSLIDDLSPLFAEISADLLSELGARVSVYRVSQTKRADNSPIKAFTAEVDLTDVAADVLDPITAAKRNAFGLTSKAEMFLLLPVVDGVLPVINQGDGFKFTSGPYANRLFTADADGMADAQGVNLGVSIVSAPNGTVMV